MTDRLSTEPEPTCPRCGAPWMPGAEGRYYWCGSAPGNQDEAGTTCKSLAAWLPKLRAQRDALRSVLRDVLTDGVQDCDGTMAAPAASGSTECQCSTARAKRLLEGRDDA